MNKDLQALLRELEEFGSRNVEGPYSREYGRFIELSAGLARTFGKSQSPAAGSGMGGKGPRDPSAPAVAAASSNCSRQSL